ncbi:MAG: glycosyltransferase family 9 protein [Deltaproteobacteria bacterium]|nr:glycosyltransferase family 9 protein [Deltaproteobacteria bacterium]
MVESGRRVDKPPRRVALVQTAFVGDVVFASPLVHAIKTKYPQSSLAMMVRPDKAELAACIPGVDEVVSFDKRGSESGIGGLVRAARKLRRGDFDLLISPHRSSRTAILAGMSGVADRLGYWEGLGKLFYNLGMRPRAGEPCSLLQDLALLKQIGIESPNPRLRLRAPGSQLRYRQDFYQRNRLADDARLVGMCIGSLWPTKRWPPVYFASLAGFLSERNYHPVMFGGPEEQGIARQIEPMAKGSLLSCVGNSLVESAAMLECCEMVVGGDTGLTHMARALGVKTVIIYGPTDPRMHYFGDGCKVLTAHVKCRPCSRHGHMRCPERHHDCMRLVSPEKVIEALREIAGLQTPAPAAISRPEESQPDLASR